MVRESLQRLDAGINAIRNAWRRQLLAAPAMVVESNVRWNLDPETGIVVFDAPLDSTPFARFTVQELEPLSVLGYDPRTGIVRIAQKLGMMDELRADYLYEEQRFPYRGYWDGDTFVELDLNPTHGHECVVDGARVPTRNLLGRTLWLYLYPVQTVDQTTGTVSDYVVDGPRLRHTFDSTEMQLLRLVHPEILVLGSLTLSFAKDVADVSVMDARTRGGGLKSHISVSDIRKRNPTSLSYWDVTPLTGLPYSPNGLGIVSLPKKVLKSFTETEAGAIVRAHAALGVRTIVQFHEKPAYDVLIQIDVTAGVEVGGELPLEAIATTMDLEGVSAGIDLYGNDAVFEVS
jgi:hypothetical protein